MFCLWRRLLKKYDGSLPTTLCILGNLSILDSSDYVINAEQRSLTLHGGGLDLLISREMSEPFFDIVAWVTEQQVGARQAKGLASSMIRWEGMLDHGPDKHRGILSHSFIEFQWERRAVDNQSERSGLSVRNWAIDTIKGDSPEEVDNSENNSRNRLYYTMTEYTMSDIQISTADPSFFAEAVLTNLGGIILYLLVTVEGYTQAGSELKCLLFITGRQYLPLYYKEKIKVQRTFLDAFLKSDDHTGWSTGTAPKETKWPIALIQQTWYYLTSQKELVTPRPRERLMEPTYPALRTLENISLVQFTTPAVECKNVITGHIVAHLDVSMSPGVKEGFYTGAAASPVSLCKDGLRVSDAQGSVVGLSSTIRRLTGMPHANMMIDKIKSPENFQGLNRINFGNGDDSVTLPKIPPDEP
ncbi:hypothetical protein BJX76DRAFT_366330 [Aspergillus varians]